MQISLKVAEVLPIYARREIMIDRWIFWKFKLHSNCVIEVSGVTRFSAYTGRVLIQKCLFTEVEKCVIILIRQSHLRSKLNPRVKMKWWGNIDDFFKGVRVLRWRNLFCQYPLHYPLGPACLCTFRPRARIRFACVPPYPTARTTHLGID